MNIDDWAALHDVKHRTKTIAEQLAPIETEVIYARTNYSLDDIRQWLYDDEGITVGETALRRWYSKRRPDVETEDRPVGGETSEAS